MSKSLLAKPKELRDIPNQHGFLLVVETKKGHMIPAMVYKSPDGMHCIVHRTQGHRILISNLIGWI